MAVYKLSVKCSPLFEIGIIKRTPFESGVERVDPREVRAIETAVEVDSLTRIAKLPSFYPGASEVTLLEKRARRNEHFKRDTTEFDIGEAHAFEFDDRICGRLKASSGAVLVNHQLRWPRPAL